MAQSSKEKFSQNARIFKEKLEVLGCPYTDGVEESWVLDLLYKPGEHRIRLLQWLFSKFDYHLHDLLDPQYVSSDSKMDSRIQRLLYVASGLGLCSPDDADLIRGTGSVHKQTIFLEQLLDLVYIMDQSEDSRGSPQALDPTFTGRSTNLRDQFTKDCWFVDTLAEQENIENVFMSDAKLLPPDITKELRISGQEREQKGQQPELDVPEISELESLAADFAKDLQKHEAMLEDLKKMHDYPPDDPQGFENLQTKLRLALSELSQLVIGFSYCFQNEMHQWCNRSPPQLSELGPAFKRIHSLLDPFVTMLGSVDSIHDSHKNMCQNLPVKVRHIAADVGSSKENRLFSVIRDFQDHVSVLEESLQRLEKSSPSSSPSPLAHKLAHIPTLS